MGRIARGMLQTFAARGRDCSWDPKDAGLLRGFK